MTMMTSKPALALAAAAALSMTATPALADGWGRYRHHHHDIDAGDIFAGLLIVGGIAAIASAASNGNRDRREARYPEPYPDTRYPSDQDYRDYRDYRDRSGRYGEPGDNNGDGASGWRGGESMDGAVDACIDEIERGNRHVDTVDGVNRDDEGWRVNGRIRDGRSYSCTVGGDGRILRVIVDGRAII